jgi:hypothetical protein
MSPFFHFLLNLNYRVCGLVGLPQKSSEAITSSPSSSSYANRICLRKKVSTHAQESKQY